jgi:hypothetical protein
VSESDSGVGEDVAVVSQCLPKECHDGEVAYEWYLSIYYFFCLNPGCLVYQVSVFGMVCLAMDDLWDILFNNAVLL